MWEKKKRNLGEFLSNLCQGLPMVHLVLLVSEVAWVPCGSFGSLWFPWLTIVLPVPEVPLGSSGS